MRIIFAPVDNFFGAFVLDARRQTARGLTVVSN